MFTITTDRRTFTVEASNRRKAVHAAVSQLASGERIVAVR